MMQLKDIRFFVLSELSSSVIEAAGGEPFAIQQWKRELLRSLSQSFLARGFPSQIYERLNRGNISVRFSLI